MQPMCHSLVSVLPHPVTTNSSPRYLSGAVSSKGRQIGFTKPAKYINTWMSLLLLLFDLSITETTGIEYESELGLQTDKEWWRNQSENVWEEHCEENILLSNSNNSFIERKCMTILFVCFLLLLFSLTVSFKIYIFLKYIYWHAPLH